MNKKYGIIEIGSNNTKTHIYENNTTIEFKNNYNKKNKTQLIPDVFVYCNWNIPPFIMEERQFTEYAKKQLVISIRTFLHRALI